MLYFMVLLFRFYIVMTLSTIKIIFKIFIFIVDLMLCILIIDIIYLQNF